MPGITMMAYCESKQRVCTDHLEKGGVLDSHKMFISAVKYARNYLIVSYTHDKDSYDSLCGWWFALLDREYIH